MQNLNKGVYFFLFKKKTLRESWITNILKKLGDTLLGKRNAEKQLT